MPGSVSVQNARGTPQIPPDADFGICIIGTSTKNPVSAGQVTPPYSSPQAAASDLGLGDSVDCLCQAITVRKQSNPAPQGCSFIATPATTQGSRGATLNTSGVTGSCVVTKTASTHPVGTFQPVARVTQGFTVGTAGGYVQFSPDGGRTWLPPTAAGTSTSIKMQIDGQDTGVQYDLAAGDLNTGDTWNESLTAPGIWGDADLFSGGADPTGAFVAIATSASSFGLLVLTEPVAAGDFTTLTSALDYLETFNKRPVLLCRFRDPYQAASTTIASGSNSQTLPQSTIHVASTAGFAPTGQIEIGADTVTYTGLTSTTFTGCTGGSGTLSTSEAVTQAAETDAAFILAFQAFAVANQDARIVIVAGNGWLTDALRSFRYFRNGLPSLVARLQGNVAKPGRYGERLAKSPAWGNDGPLSDFTLVDDNQNPIPQAHDELVRGGIDGPMAGGTGGGVTFCYQRSVGVVGTYVSEAPCLYPASSTVLTLMDARVTNGIMRELYAVAWTEIQGTAIVNGGILDPDVCVAMATRYRDAILAKFAKEIANPGDPNLVKVDPSVTTSGQNASMKVYVNDELFDYLNGIDITLFNIRSS